MPTLPLCLRRKLSSWRKRPNLVAVVVVVDWAVAVVVAVVEAQVTELSIPRRVFQVARRLSPTAAVVAVVVAAVVGAAVLVVKNKLCGVGPELVWMIYWVLGSTTVSGWTIINLWTTVHSGA